ncbi:MAG: hypothetical protein HQK51_15020 [Oligoflexia bacterium]|nr:hypothetical protein [Oligoflexia bacterium]
MKFFNTKKQNKFYFSFWFVVVSLVLLNECLILPSYAMIVARVKKEVTRPMPEPLSLPVVTSADATTAATTATAVNTQRLYPQLHPYSQLNLLVDPKFKFKVEPSAPPLPLSEQAKQATKEEDDPPPAYTESEGNVAPPKEISRECTSDPITFKFDGSSPVKIIFSEAWKKFLQDTFGVKLGKIEVSYDKVTKNGDGTATYENPRIKVEGEDRNFSPSVNKDFLANLLAHSSAIKMKPSEKILFKNYKNIIIKGPQELEENAEKEDSYVQSITCKIDDADDFKRLEIASKEMAQEKQKRDDEKRADARKLLEQAATAREQSAKMIAKQKQIKTEEERIEVELAKAKSEIASRDKMQQELKAAEDRKAKLAQEQTAIRAAQEEATAGIAKTSTSIAEVQKETAKIREETAKIREETAESLIKQEQSKKEIADKKSLLLAQKRKMDDEINGDLKKLEQAEQAIEQAEQARERARMRELAGDIATGVTKTTTTEAVYIQVKIDKEIGWKSPHKLADDSEFIWLEEITDGVTHRGAINYCEEVNKKYSKLGYKCNLPSREQYEQLGRDMGYGSKGKGYTPQIFSNVGGKQFWSLSHTGSYFPYYLNGFNGSVSYRYNSSLSSSARCVCIPWI